MRLYEKTPISGVTDRVGGHNVPLEALGPVHVSQCRVKRETDSDVIEKGAKGKDRCRSHGFLALMHHQKLCNKTLILHFSLC